MNRLLGLTVCAGAALGFAHASVLAVPPVLEKAPKDAMFVLAIPSAQKFEKSLQSLTTAAEVPLPLPGVEELLAMAGMGEGLDLAKGVAIVVMPAPAGAGAAEVEELRDRAVVMLPVTDYAAFLQNFSAKPGAAGSIDSLNVNGSDAFARNLGDGYALISPNKQAVTDFKPGNPTAKADLGKLGERISDSADFVVVVNMEVARPVLEQGAKAAKDRVADQIAMMGVDGNAAAESPVLAWLSNSLVSDARTVVAGLKAGGMGASLEMAANFKEGSPMAAACQAAGNAGALLAKLPNTQYLIAGAIDTSSPGIKKMLRDVAAKVRESAGTDTPQMFTGALADADGQSIVVGMNPTMLMGGGVLTNTVNFTSSKESAKVIAGVKSDMEALNGKSFQGMTYEASFKDKAAKVGDKSVDVWQVKMQADSGDGMSAQAASVIFGPQGGPGGYLAEVDGGVLRTFAKNSALMSAAFKSASGGDNLGSDTLIKQVAGQLPSGRIAEAYIGSRNIVDMLVPMAAMMGVQVNLDAIPAQLPPLGLAISSEGGSAHLAFFIPAPVIKTIWVVGEGLAPQLEGLGGLGEMGEQPPADEPTGQPRF